MGIVSRLARLRNLGLGARVALVTSVMLLLFVATVPIAWWHDGGMGLLASAAAATVCLVGALGALIASDHFRGPSRALHGLAWSMAARTGLPLLWAVVLSLQQGGLAKAGAVYYVLVFYFVALAVETPLSLRPEPARRDFVS